MKKILALILALAMLVTLMTACSEDEAPAAPQRGDNRPSSERESSEREAPAPGNEEPAPGNDEPAASTGGFTTGTWDGNVFTNESTGIKFTMPEGDGLVRLSDSEIQAVLGLGEEAMIATGTASRQEIDFSRVNHAYEFYLTNNNDDAMFLMYEGVTPFTPTEENYIAILVSQLVEMYATFGFESTVLPNTNVTIAGKQFVKGSLEVDVPIFDDYSFTFYQDYFVGIQGGMFIIISTTYDDDSPASFLDIMSGFAAA
jgi:hypothetical protein